MRPPDFQPQFLSPSELAEKLRPQIKAAELAVHNAWAEMEDAHLLLDTAVRRLEILASLWPSEIPPRDDAPTPDS